MSEQSKNIMWYRTPISTTTSHHCWLFEVDTVQTLFC